MDIFVHLPRTGGTSISNALLLQYGIMATYRCNQVQPGIYKMRRRVDVSKTCVVMGHVPYGIHEQLGVASASYFTMLREPFARIVSHYKYVKSNPKHHLHEQVVSKKLSFEQYVSGNLSPELSNGMVRQLSGHPAAWEPNPDFNELYEMALQNLDKFCAIGFIEDFALSLALFHDRLQWTLPPCIMLVNQTQKNMVVDDGFREVQDIVYACNEKDVLLHDYARKRFARETENIEIGISQSMSSWRAALYVNVHRAMELL